jgi:hypothetical protein
MKTIAIVAAMSLFVVSVAAVASADTLVMRDGTRVEGTVVGIAARTITFRHADGVSRRYFTSQVEALEFLSAERANPGAVRGHRIVARAGTEFVVRTMEAIDSRHAGADQLFSAIVEQDVASDSSVVIPRGSSVQLMIRQVSSGGATGSAEMALDIQSIAIAGRRYSLGLTEMTPETATDTGAGRRTAETIDAAAVLGTIIDAGARGGKGAPILTRGRDVHVPAETAIRFRLDKSVALQAER